MILLLRPCLKSGPCHGNPMCLYIIQKADLRFAIPASNARGGIVSQCISFFTITTGSFRWTFKAVKTFQTWASSWCENGDMEEQHTEQALTISPMKMPRFQCAFVQNCLHKWTKQDQQRVHLWESTKKAFAPKCSERSTADQYFSIGYS